MRAEHRAFVVVAGTPEDLLARFAAYRAPPVQRWLDGGAT